MSSKLITIYCARGIGERLDHNMLGQVTKYLDTRYFRVRELPWRAEYGMATKLDGRDFNGSLIDGIGLGVDAIRRDSNPVILAGFSGGAALTRMLASQISRGQHGTDLEVIGLANIADPFRPRGLGLPVAEGWGIAGEISVWGMQQWDVSDVNDVICCCPANSPLRTFADQTSAMSLVDPAAWGANLLWRLRFQQWQQVAVNFRDPLSVIAQYREAIHDAEGYLHRGDHVEYAIRRRPGTTIPHTMWLAQQLNEFAAKRVRAMA